jgi:hypothetical protein
MIDWFNKEPGGPLVQEQPDGSVMAVLGDGDIVPDTVRAPRELGGQVLRVLAAGTGPCVCGVDHLVKHMRLETDLCVAECDQFLWYREKQ